MGHAHSQSQDEVDELPAAPDAERLSVRVFNYSVGSDHDHVVYFHVGVSPAGTKAEYTVYRQYKDVASLHQSLRACRPRKGSRAHPLPPRLPSVPPKSAFGRPKPHDDAIFLHSRQELFGEYLIDLVEQYERGVLPTGSVELISDFLTRDANQLPRGMRSPHALINDGKDPYSEATPDSPQGRLERSKTVDQLRPRLASHLSTRQSLHSPRNESLVYAQWFHQLQSDTHTSGFRGSREVLVIMTNKSIEWWSGKSPFVGRDKHSPHIVDMVRHTPDHSFFLESEEYKLLIKVPLADVLHVSYSDASPLGQRGPTFEFWTSQQSNYIFQASISWASGGRSGGSKQTLQAVQYLADRLATVQVRVMCLRSVLQHVPTSLEVERDTQAYMQFCRATDMVGLADLSLAADLAKEFVSQEEKDDLFSEASKWEAGCGIDLQWASQIWNGCHGGARDLVDYGGFLMFMHGLEGAILANKLYMTTPRPRSVTKESLTPRGREARTEWSMGPAAAGVAADEGPVTGVRTRAGTATTPPIPDEFLREQPMEPALKRALSEQGRQLYRMASSGSVGGGGEETKGEWEEDVVDSSRFSYGDEETKGEWEEDGPMPPIIPPPTPPSTPPSVARRVPFSAPTTFPFRPLAPPPPPPPRPSAAGAPKLIGDPGSAELKYFYRR